MMPLAIGGEFSMILLAQNDILGTQNSDGTGNLGLIMHGLFTTMKRDP
jgi:hypothetical protein